jgi:hypothetical protein
VSKSKASLLPNSRPSRSLHPTTAEVVQKYSSDGNGWIIPEKIFSATANFWWLSCVLCTNETNEEMNNFLHPYGPHTFFHLIHKFCGFINSATAKPRTNRKCTYSLIDAENMSATQKVNELLNHMVAETFFIASFQ